MLLHTILLLVYAVVLSMGHPITENVTSIHTVEDLAAFIPVEKQVLEMYVNIVRKSIQALGGKEGIKALSEAIDDYFQFWIDADVRNLPVEDYQKEALRQTFLNSSQVLSRVNKKYQHLFPVFSILKTVGMFSDKVLDAVLESSTFNEVCEITRLNEKILQLLRKTKRLEKWKRYYHLFFSIANELLAKNWLGLAEIEVLNTSCWPDVKSILLDMIKLSEEAEFLEKEMHQFIKGKVDIDIRDKKTLDTKLETVVCQLEGVKSLSDLAILHHSSEKRFREQYKIFKKTWKEIGGMNRIRIVATALDNLFQLAIDINFSNPKLVRSMGRQELEDRLMEYKKVLYFEHDLFNKTIDAKEEANFEGCVKMLADALVEDPDRTMFITAYCFPSLKRESDHFPILKKLLQLVVKLLEKLHYHGLMVLK